MMKATKYKPVEKLPHDAIKVSKYASDNKISVAYVYIKHTRKLASYDIVSFQGINFVVNIS